MPAANPCRSWSTDSRCPPPFPWMPYYWHMRGRIAIPVALAAVVAAVALLSCGGRTDPPEVQARIEYQKGRALQEQGSIKKAGDAYARAVHLDPTFAAAYVGRGYAYLEHENLYNALEDFDKAIELDDRLHEAYNYRGLVSLGMADPEQAMLDFSKAIEVSPNFADAYVNRARLHFSRRDLASAIEDMTAAIREEPDEMEHYLSRAQMHLYNSDPDGAAADLDQVLALTDDPDLELAAKRLLAQIRGG